MKIKLIVTTALLSIMLVACGGQNTGEEAKDLDTKEIKELVHGYTVGEVQAASASITSTELLVTDSDDKETVYELPEEDFFVSIAPFINETHPCEVHSLTGCQGELVEQDVEMYIEDSEGNVVLDETKKTEANGFIDLWLPRDDTYNVTITQDDKKTTANISTFQGDNTCITTMQLS